MEKEFWVDFSGYLKIKAKNPDEAEQKFWDFINNNVKPTRNNNVSDDVWEIETVEEYEKGVY
jgi:hypothetical protein